MKSLRFTILLSLVVLLLAGCAALPPITALGAQTPAAQAPEAQASTEQRAPEVAPAADEVAPAVTTTVAVTPTVPLATEPVTSTGAISATTPITTTAPETDTAPSEDQIMGANPLVGVQWEWAATLKTRPATQAVVPDPTAYTLEFAEDGAISIKADCNRALATYTLENDSLTITLGPTTLAACPPGSQGGAMLTWLSKVTSYMIDAGDLILRVDDTGDSLLFRNGGPTVVPVLPPATEAPAGAAPEITPTPLPVTIEAPASEGETLQLVGPTWQWEKFVDVATGENNMDVKNPENYTVTFAADGTAAMKADCNVAAATYKLDGSSLTIEVGPVTLAACGADSLTDTFLINLTSAASFKLENGKLSVDLMADGGQMVFGAAK